MDHCFDGNSVEKYCDMFAQKKNCGARETAIASEQF
jgi:hypothetical protein